MSKVIDVTKEIVRKRLRSKGGRGARSMITDLHHTTGLSIGYLYKITADVREINGRRRRSDARKRRIEIPENSLNFMYGLTIGYDLGAEWVIELAERNGKIKAGAITPATYNRWLRECGLKTAKGQKSEIPPCVYTGDLSTT